MHKYTNEQQSTMNSPYLDHQCAFSLVGLRDFSELPESSLASSEIPESLAKVQLPVVGVSSPSCELWKSPKSPKLESKDESSISSESDGENVNGSDPLAAVAVSANGPNPSWELWYQYSLVKDHDKKIGTNIII